MFKTLRRKVLEKKYDRAVRQYLNSIGTEKEYKMFLKMERCSRKLRNLEV